MSPEAERAETRKAMAFDLLQILKEKPEQTTYTAAEIEKIICLYGKTMAYDLHKILDRNPAQETYTKEEVKKLIDVYVETANQA